LITTIPLSLDIMTTATRRASPHEAHECYYRPCRSTSRSWHWERQVGIPLEEVLNRPLPYPAYPTIPHVPITKTLVLFIIGKHNPEGV